MKSPVDVLIIGAGPAGLSSALALSRQLYTAVVFDSQSFRNARSHHMHTIPTWDHRDAADYRAAARNELCDRYNTTEFVDRKVMTLRRQDDGLFRATEESGQYWTGKKLILASGVHDIYPDLPGFDACWGYSIYHCLFCHGFEERNTSHAGLLAVDQMANPQFAIAIACMAKRFASEVTIFTHGNETLAAELQLKASNHGLIIHSARIIRLERLEPQTREARMRVHLVNGDAIDMAFMAHTPRTRQAGVWHEADQLGLELSDNGDIKTFGMFGETSLGGVFAVGDCGNVMKAVPTAIMSGVLAAGGVSHQVAQGH